MAFYDFAVTIPAKQTEAIPYEKELKLTKGVIHRVEVEFPKGCRGYVYLAIDHYKHQLFPSAKDNYFRSDGYTIAFLEHYRLTKAPYVLIARGWAPDASYDHTIPVRIGVLPLEVVSPWERLTDYFKKFFKLLGVK